MDYLNHIPDLIIDALGGEDAIQLIVLFGSAARGDLTAKSDIDIAVAGSGPLDIDLIADLQLRVSRLLGREVDLIDLGSVDGLIMKKIFENGAVLLNKNRSLYAQFIKKVIYFDADILPNLRMILRKRAARFARG